MILSPCGLAIGLRSLLFFLCRLLAWLWIAGVVIWPAMLPLSLASHVVRQGAAPALACLVRPAWRPLKIKERGTS